MIISIIPISQWQNDLLFLDDDDNLHGHEGAATMDKRMTMMAVVALKQ